MDIIRKINYLIRQIDFVIEQFDPDTAMFEFDYLIERFDKEDKTAFCVELINGIEDKVTHYYSSIDNGDLSILGDSVICKMPNIMVYNMLKKWQNQTVKQYTILSELSDESGEMIKHKLVCVIQNICHNTIVFYHVLQEEIERLKDCIMNDSERKEIEIQIMKDKQTQDELKAVDPDLFELAVCVGKTIAEDIYKLKGKNNFIRAYIRENHSQIIEALKKTNNRIGYFSEIVSSSYLFDISTKSVYRWLQGK